MAGVDVDTLTMEQYLALSRENQAPGMVKPEIGGNVNFKIKSQFMHELREALYLRTNTRMLTITLIGSSASLAYSIFPDSLKTQSCSEFSPLLFPGPQKGGWTDSPQELSIPGISSKKPLSKAWERNIRSGSSSDGLVALVNTLDNLERDMKKLKESVHAIQVGCQIYKGPHLDKDCPLTKEVKQIEEVRYGEFCLLMGTMEESFRSTKMEVWIKKLQENAKINTGNQYASLKKLETQIEQLTEELRSRKEKSKQAKVVIVEHEGPSSPKKIKNLHGISFISDSQEENTTYEGI
ncbi:hypothetical protein Tco_0153463 [Tanacetum coccineum]